jgi:hypothetical protein
LNVVREKFVQPDFAKSLERTFQIVGLIPSYSLTDNTPYYTQYTCRKNGTILGRGKSKKQNGENVTEEDILQIEGNSMIGLLVDFIKKEEDIKDEYYDDEERPKVKEINEVIDDVESESSAGEEDYYSEEDSSHSDLHELEVPKKNDIIVALPVVPVDKMTPISSVVADVRSLAKPRSIAEIAKASVSQKTSMVLNKVGVQEQSSKIVSAKISQKNVQQTVIKKLSTSANNLVANLLTMDNNPVAVMPPLVLVPPVIPTATLLTVAPTTQIDFS